MDFRANPGDKVKIKTNDGEYVGVLMPRPQLVKTESVLLKLSNGYNIGVEQGKIRSVEVLEQYKAPSAKKSELTAFPGKPVVSVLSTGGTISSKVDYRTGGVYASYTAADLMGSMPELSNKVNLKTQSVMNVMSEDMTPANWVQMAEAAAKELNSGASGVVLTHGTDTMHYSSAALSFLLNKTTKPIVFTGAQRSVDRGSSDAFLNLSCAISFAASDFAGVTLVMHGSMEDNFCFAHNGVRVRKMHTSRRDAFKSINAKPIAKISHEGVVEFLQDHKARAEGKCVVDGAFDANVAFIKVYPAMDPGVLDYFISKGVHGIVFEGTALGHVPTTVKEHSLIPGIERARDKKIPMSMTTQCLHGRVNPLVYSNLREVSSRGVIYCEDMLPEVAYVKMMWALNKSRDAGKVRGLMLTDVAGEISERTIIEEE
ncbi:MAG: Glu-tRNA(Gln) amidotransferase subunit GatD [Candidatus Altiarchaeota archaeon]|nr:Glu-tRNA(Gln) amidotransferase subunit GatD [Candidatus Altiarchaeota archaeon]